ncbi:MAG: molecular chaperone TorD family protein [Chlamydiae bacterium]|nr:molecular chaperone TorD family protein [Chlamydiota bacterium]
MSGPTNIKTLSEIDELLGRSFFYQLLASLFRHPSSGLGRAFVSETGSNWEHWLDVARIPRANELKNILKSLLEQLHASSDEEWTQHYERTFGHTACGKVPAYELEYGEEHSHRQPQELSDISAFYQAFGLKAADTARERVDHVSSECEFMYYLLYKTAYALENHGEEKAFVCRDAAKSFLENHLGRWLPGLTVRLSNSVGIGLMHSIAEFAFCFIVSDCEKSDVNPGPRDLPIRRIQEKLETGCVSCLAGC